MAIGGGTSVTVLHPTGVSGIPWTFAAKAAGGVVVTDSRTVSGRIIMAFADGDQFVVRAIRTEGANALQTVADGSGITAIVYRN